MGVGMSGLYLADIILLVAGPIALDKIGWKFFFVLIIPTAFNIAFVYFLCPETKGRSLVSLAQISPINQPCLICTVGGHKCTVWRGCCNPLLRRHS